MATRIAELRDSGGRAGYADLDDRFLVLDFQAGNQDLAFIEIHRRYSGLARHICQKILGNADDADEAMQETMLRVYQGLPRFNGRYMVQPWVARIATNVSLDIVRARARRPVAQVPLIDAHDNVVEAGDRDPEALVERRFEQDRVKDALAELPPNHRRALVMREFEGRSHNEIAEALGITPKQAKALIHRAKSSFRRVWSADGERRGIAAIVPILLAPFRLPDFVRRIIGSAGEAAATSGAAGSVASGTVVTAGERVAAAAVAVAMATTVGVGAFAIRDRIAREPDPVRDRKPQAQIAAAPAVPERVSKVAPVREPKAPDHKAKTDPKPLAVGPAVSPSESPSPSPSVEPSDSPTPPPTETTPPPPPPAPAWAMSFSAIGRTASLTQITSEVTGTAGRNILFNQASTGTLGGKNPIAVHAEYWGTAQGAAGTVNMWLFLDTPSGRYRYDGSGGLQAVVSPDDGTTTYTFSGTYSLVEWPEADTSLLAAKMPQSGSFDLTLSFWQDRATLYAVDLALPEAPAES